MHITESSLPVLIVGGGIAGVATALSLGRQGHAVQLLEQADQIGAIGYGVQIGPNVGSCGTAAFQKSLVIVEDIANDEKWCQAAPIALAEGMQACWSMPMVSKHDEVLGTFALYCTDKRSPNKDELELMIACCRFAAVALERRPQA